ncbi:MAG: hypothetical protein ACRC8K_00770, partial [Waterburya sp.]
NTSPEKSLIMAENFLIYSQLEAEAKSENTSGDRLWELAQQDDNLALIVAQNIVAPEKVLKELSESNNSAIRKAVCANPNTPTETLLNLSFDFPKEVMNNPLIPLLLLENPYVLTCDINFDFNKIKQLTDIEIKRLGWTRDQGRSHLQKTYGKRSRLHLSNEELYNFYCYLKSI